MEKFIKILLAVALFFSSMSALVNAESPQTATSELQTVILEREIVPPIQYLVPIGVNIIQLDTTDLPCGIYNVSYVVDGEVINAAKFSK